MCDSGHYVVPAGSGIAYPKGSRAIMQARLESALKSLGRAVRLRHTDQVYWRRYGRTKIKEIRRYRKALGQ